MVVGSTLTDIFVLSNNLVSHTLYGSAGDDTFGANAANDVAFGGAGNDRLEMFGASATVSMTAGLVTDGGTVSFGEFQHGKGLPIDDFGSRKNLP